MSTASNVSSIQHEPELLGQTVVVIGSSAGIGLETARRARAEGAKLILTGRNPERLQHAASELDALSTGTFDATDPASLERFFRDLSSTIDHVMVTAGRPIYGRLLGMDLAQLRRTLDEHLLLAIQVARYAANKMRPGGTPAVHGRHRRPPPSHWPGDRVDGHRRASRPHRQPRARARAHPSLIAAGFVDTSLSASLLGNELENRRNQLRATLPIRRVVGPADVAALAVHIMTNPALTGATYDVDGGQQLIG